MDRRISVVIKRILPVDRPDWSRLVEESLHEHYRHIERMAEEFTTGANRFDRLGEALFGAYRDGQLVGIGGLNRDPYGEAQNSVGRVRRVYVSPSCRGTGIALLLMETIIREARLHFQVLTLRTDNPIAERLYRKLGFVVTDAYLSSTHVLTLDDVAVEE
ncbi:GNAT family N-acetyltransferase [Paenibacillus koleovorans]|uniref:GNAT family N-acetyltransferase n=1 Tax=Paenibacillus koleovorans TaxID=121608 RepID=UPI000FD7F0E2|nr:GNAT family N-acetyltransferase [Paenibacillus koleovorans]